MTPRKGSGRITSFEDGLLLRNPVPSAGRIASFEDALRLLGDDVRSSGVPASVVMAIAVDDVAAPDVVADFAARIMLIRDGHNLRERQPGERVRRAQASNLWWIAWGPIVRASDGGLVIGSLSLAPRRPPPTEKVDVQLGVTGALLRALTPAQILADAVAYLRRTAHWLDVSETLGHTPAPEAQKRALARAAEPGSRQSSRVSDDDLARIAARYVDLFRRGVRRPLPLIATEFGLSRTQARDRVHRARERDFLTAGTRGRAGGEPGPRLLERWNPPEGHPYPRVQGSSTRPRQTSKSKGDN